MWRFIFVAFLIAHGGVHVAMWAMPAPPDAPFDATRSWLLGTRRGLAVAWAIAAAALLVGAGVGLWAHAEWWRAVAVAGLAVSFGLMVVYFHRWFLFIEVVNAGLIVGLVWLDWPTQSMVGA